MPTYLSKKEKFNTLFLSIKPIFTEKKYMEKHKRLKKFFDETELNTYEKFKNLNKGKTLITYSDNDLFWELQYLLLKEFILIQLSKNAITFPIQKSDGEIIKKSLLSNPFYKLEHPENDHYDAFSYKNKTDNTIIYYNFKKIHHLNHQHKENNLHRLPIKSLFPINIFIKDITLLEEALYEIKFVDSKLKAVRFEVVSFRGQKFLITTPTETSKNIFKSLISEEFRNKKIGTLQYSRNANHPLEQYFNELYKKL